MTNFPTINSTKIFGKKALNIDFKFNDLDDFIEITVITSKNHVLSNQLERINIITVITCNATYFNYTTTELKFKIKKENLFGRVEVKPMVSIVAAGTFQITEAIDEFYNDEFIVDKGEIISDFNSYFFNIDDENQDSDTIVKFNFNENQVKPLDLILDDDIILISFGDKVLFQYMEELEKRNPELAFSILPATAILSALEYIKNENFSYKERGWFQKIENELNQEYDDIADLEEFNSEQTFDIVFNKLFLSGKLKQGLANYLKYHET